MAERVKRKYSRSSIRPTATPDFLQPKTCVHHARTNITKTVKKPSRDNSPSSSSQHSLESSSSSSNNLSDEEIKFNQIDLHPMERRVPASNTDSIVSRMIYGRPEVRIGGEGNENDENWIPDTAAMAANMPNMVPSESQSVGTVKVFDTVSGEFYLSSRESAMAQFSAGADLIVECSNYTRQDVIFFAKQLQINAVLSWELLTKYTPDKYQKFGQKCSLYAINRASNVEGLKSRSQPIKIIRLPRMLLMFSADELPLGDIIPASVKKITSDNLLYLILQHCINQTEEIVGELKVLVKRVYDSSFSPASVTQRYENREGQTNL